MNTDSLPPPEDSGDRGDCYEIVVEGRLDGRWSDWFAGLAVENRADGCAVLRGPLPDQAALHGVLLRILNLNLPLISLRRVVS